MQRRATSSVAHHLLVNYQRAHVAVIKAQFTCKRLRDGMEVRPAPWWPRHAPATLQAVECTGLKVL